MQRDVKHNVKSLVALYPAAAGTTGTGRTSGIIDRRGYNGVGFEMSYGSTAATTLAVSATILECDTTGGSFTSVADSDLIGTEAAASLATSATRVSGVSKNVTKQVDYIGKKPYLKVKLVPLVSAGFICGANVLLSNPLSAPAA